jgi:hypothetical protein
MTCQIFMGRTRIPQQKRLREAEAGLAHVGRVTTLGALAGIHPVFLAYANEANNVLPTANWSTRHDRLAR